MTLDKPQISLAICERPQRNDYRGVKQGVVHHGLFELLANGKSNEESADVITMSSLSLPHTKGDVKAAVSL